jgi:hypothetical protein
MPPQYSRLGISVHGELFPAGKRSMPYIAAGRSLDRFEPERVTFESKAMEIVKPLAPSLLPLISESTLASRYAGDL